jgi:hypothetical protein
MLLYYYRNGKIMRPKVFMVLYARLCAQNPYSRSRNSFNSNSALLDNCPRKHKSHAIGRKAFQTKSHEEDHKTLATVTAGVIRSTDN